MKASPWRLEPGLGLDRGVQTSLVKGLSARDDLGHLLFDRGEILRREGLVAIEIVIKAVLDHRPDRDLGAGKKRLHRFGEDMRGVVANEFERAWIVAGDELDLARRASTVSARSHKVPSSIIATERFASDGEMLLAMSNPLTPGSKARAAPSGKSPKSCAGLHLLTRRYQSA